jgi:ParB-like nuclease domain
MLKTKEFLIEDLLKMGNPGNPRWMPEPEKESLTASLKTFGLVEPLVVNIRSNQIVGGHQRVSVAVNAGLSSLTAVVLDLPQAEETALLLSLNKIRGYWDYGKLAEMLADIPLENLVATGFSAVEVESIIASYSSSDSEEIASPGVVPEFQNRTEEQVNTWLNSTYKVQFGMFSKTLKSTEYDAWVKTIAIELGGDNTSPTALGAVIANMLSISLHEGWNESTETSESAQV